MNNKTIIIAFGCSAVLSASVIISSLRYINTLKEKLANQELRIEEIYIKTNYKHVDSLYLEIMDIGAKLDSCLLSNESLEYYIQNTK